jgi:hypothetical protein
LTPRAAGTRIKIELTNRIRRCIVLKRFVAAAFISVLAVIGVAPAANAATASHHHATTSFYNIDWD